MIYVQYIVYVFPRVQIFVILNFFLKSASWQAEVERLRYH